MKRIRSFRLFCESVEGGSGTTESQKESLAPANCILARDCSSARVQGFPLPSGGGPAVRPGPTTLLAPHKAARIVVQLQKSSNRPRYHPTMSPSAEVNGHSLNGSNDSHVNGSNGTTKVSRPLTAGIWAPIPTFFFPETEDIGEFPAYL